MRRGYERQIIWGLASRFDLLFPTLIDLFHGHGNHEQGHLKQPFGLDPQ
jgi:hypothetical protein